MGGIINLKHQHASGVPLAMKKLVKLQFHHGIGDCVYFAHQLPLYTRRGYRFQIQCSPGKQFIFSDCDSTAMVRDPLFPKHPWLEEGQLDEIEPEHFFVANKAVRNISLPPMPDIGLPDHGLWEEYSSIRLNLTKYVGHSDRQAIANRFRDLPKPVVLIHSSGNSLKGAKDMNNQVLHQTCRQILHQTGGSVVILNWDEPCLIDCPGVFPMKTLFPDSLSIPKTIALFEASALLIGIDSGPAHLARFTNLPVLFVWKDHHPAAFSLPRDKNFHLVPESRRSSLNRHFRHFFNLIECCEPVVSPESISRTVARFFAGERFIRESPGADLQFQNLVFDRIKSPQRGPDDDRSRGMSIFCDGLLERSGGFSLIETGTMSPREEWRKAGCSTLLFTLLAYRRGGTVYSVDIDPAKCRAAMANLRYFTGHVHLIRRDSVAFLADFSHPVDGIYLDSLNLQCEGLASHCLAEAQRAERLLIKGGLVAINECRFAGGRWLDRGTWAAPWLLDHGFEVVFCGELSIFRKKKI